MFRKLIVWMVNNEIKAHYLLAFISVINSIIVICIFNLNVNKVITMCVVILPVYAFIHLFKTIGGILTIRISLSGLSGNPNESVIALISPTPFIGQGLLAWRCIVLLDEIRCHIKSSTLTIEEIEKGIYLNSPENIKRRKKEGLV